MPHLVIPIDVILLALIWIVHCKKVVTLFLKHILHDRPHQKLVVATTSDHKITFGYLIEHFDLFSCVQLLLAFNLWLEVVCWFKE